ncbi:MAG: hypothetical protein COV00_02430 [Candidatus Tagabacteria bacterium CG10_big_fil_rev_8_21_14_0_10_40_13]|uniref:Uncharacterized protein n=1 Tax=Candidatus Tagabacteria bacterium CG10_big_fil_rev_8_21_14_0_10_40_13 TaxID=1975022 RepID=A0A2M8L8I7_9BACT|nr:MAG: hypothetical protein COV00_02430 [Candidatus Tagabacteria bacterium CG10_big_fil_rev_8_21_14_0_10_40_13]
MWQKNITGILGIWIIFLALIDFSESLHKILLVSTGIFVALVSFFGKKIIRVVGEKPEPKKETEEDVG